MGRGAGGLGELPEQMATAALKDTVSQGILPGFGSQLLFLWARHVTFPRLPFHSLWNLHNSMIYLAGDLDVRIQENNQVNLSAQRDLYWEGAKRRGRF